MHSPIKPQAITLTKLYCTRFCVKPFMIQNIQWTHEIQSVVRSHIRARTHSSSHAIGHSVNHHSGILSINTQAFRQSSPRLSVNHNSGILSINVHLSAAWIRHEASDSMLFANRQLQSRQQAKHAFVGWLRLYSASTIAPVLFRACASLCATQVHGGSSAYGHAARLKRPAHTRWRHNPALLLHSCYHG